MSRWAKSLRTGVGGALLAVALSAAGTVCAAGTGAGAVDATFNPKPAADDVIVPMPCGGAMAFRKVYTADGSRMQDRSYNAGSSNTESFLSASPNHRYVQGAFHDENGYYYLMGKYELNVAQYKILSSYALGKGKCPQGAVGSGSASYKISDRIAQGNLSWFDAIELTRQYSYYLLSAGAKADAASLGVALPADASGASVAFARLPTDSEWEFAARGGEAVTSSEFSDELFPLEGTLADYAWYKGKDSSTNGKVNVIGLKKPNPLGFYDILGNVSEIMLDPFYATRTGRLHGQSGGYIVRGGSVLSSRAELSTALRLEKPFYVGSRESKSRDSGVRLVLSLPVTTSMQEVQSLNAEIAALGQDDIEDTKGGGNLQNLQALDALISAQKDAQSRYAALSADNAALSADNAALNEANASLVATVNSLHDGLNRLRQSMVEANSKRDEMRDRAIISSLRLGGYLCSTLASEQIAYERNLRNEELLRKMPLAQCRLDPESDACAAAKGSQEKKLENNRKLAASMLDYYASYYADHIADVTNTFDLKFLRAQKGAAQKSLGKREGTLALYIERFVDDLQVYARGSRNLKDNKMKWIKQCRALVK